MRRLVLLAVGAGLWLGPVATAPAQEAGAREIIDKAIKAHGGEKKLASFKAGQTKAKGTIFAMGMELPFAADISVQLPDKIKVAIQLEINNMNINVIQVFDGKKGWVNVLGKTSDLEDKALESFKEGLYVEEVTRLVPLKDKGFELSVIGDAKVDGKDTVGILVTKKGQRDVRMYFDKATHLMLKAEYRTIDGMTMQEVDQVKMFGEYKDLNGAKTATKITVLNDGNKTVELEITEVRLVDGFDASVFARPE